MKNKAVNRPSFAACAELVDNIVRKQWHQDDPIPRSIGIVNQQFQGQDGRGFDPWDVMDMYDALMCYASPIGKMSKSDLQEWWNVAKMLKEYEQGRPLDGATQKALDIIRANKDGVTLDELCVSLQSMAPVVEERLRPLIRIGLISRGRPDARPKGDKGGNMITKTVYMARKVEK